MPSKIVLRGTARPSRACRFTRNRYPRGVSDSAAVERLPFGVLSYADKRPYQSNNEAICQATKLSARKTVGCAPSLSFEAHGMVHRNTPG